MNLTDEKIIEDYRKEKDNFIQMGEIVHGILEGIAKDSHIPYFSIQHRVKEEKSLIGKLIRADGWYHSFYELMDILGARVICYFSDHVDVIGKAIEEAFVIDEENSSDKRKLIRSDSFGYLSLHYICSLPKDKGYPEELTNLKFEIQVRTILQHAWSDMEHDIGYKSEFGVPREFFRGFARIAGLLELADDEFVRLRDGMKDYSASVRKSIEDNTAGDIALNVVSINEFVNRNVPMKELLSKMSEICDGAEIDQADATSYIEQLSWLNIKTVGELIEMFDRNHDLALRMAQQSLAGSELDILSSNVGLRFLCRAELITKDYTEEQMADFLNISLKNKDRAQRQAGRLFRTKQMLKGEAE